MNPKKWDDCCGILAQNGKRSRWGFTSRNGIPSIAATQWNMRTIHRKHSTNLGPAGQPYALHSDWRRSAATKVDIITYFRTKTRLMSRTDLASRFPLPGTLWMFYNLKCRAATFLRTLNMENAETNVSSHSFGGAAAKIEVAGQAPKRERNVICLCGWETVGGQTDEPQIFLVWASNGMASFAHINQFRWICCD